MSCRTFSSNFFNFPIESFNRLSLKRKETCGKFNKSSIAGLWFWSTAKVQCITLCNSSEYLPGILSTFPLLIFKAKDKWLVASKGGLKEVLSYKKQPESKILLINWI